MREIRVDPDDEHHVDVRRVIELASAELAHADDGEIVGTRQPDRSVEDVGRHRGEGSGDLVERCDAQQVAGGDAQELVPLPTHELLDRLGADCGAGVEILEHRSRLWVAVEQPSQ